LGSQSGPEPLFLQLHIHTYHPLSSRVVCRELLAMSGQYEVR
jgi:hypothetical protein